MGLGATKGAPSMKYHSLKTPDLEITVEPTMAFDRGNWVAKIFRSNSLVAGRMDIQGGWPRYYFNLELAREELDSWCRANDIGVHGWTVEECGR